MHFQICIADQSQTFIKSLSGALLDPGVFLIPKETKMSKAECLFLESSQARGEES